MHSIHRARVGISRQVNEAAMTGEGDDVKKGPYVFDDQGGMLQSPFLFSGTQVGTPWHGIRRAA